MQQDNTSSRTVIVTGVSNSDFLHRYAKPGCIGLSGGITLIDKAICRAQRHLDVSEKWGLWSHAFLFQGTRLDGHHWVIESDLQIHRKHIQFGVQENRISKYFDECLFTGRSLLGPGPEGAVAAEFELDVSESRFPPADLEESLGQQTFLLRRATETQLRDPSPLCRPGRGFPPALFRYGHVRAARAALFV